MQLVISLIDFIVLVLILSSIRERLVYELSATSLLLFGSTKPGVILYSLLVLPGTIIHELSHWIVAEILGVATGRIEILPDLDTVSDTRRLGSVAMQKSGPIRSFLIGIAPFISGLAILMVLGTLLADGWSSNRWWVNALIIYAIMVVGNSMMISKSDRRAWPFIIVFFSLIFLALSRQTLISFVFLYAPVSIALQSLVFVLLVTAGVNLVMIGGSYLMRIITQKLTGKKVIAK